MIVVGAPAIGKSHQLAGIEDVTCVKTLAELQATLDGPGEASTIVVDDVYPCFREHLERTENGEEDTSLGEALSRRQDICLVTRPYSLEYLVEEFDFLERFGWEEVPIRMVAYNEKEARQCCADLDPELSRDKLDQYFDELKYTFESETLNCDYETYIPTLAMTMAEGDVKQSIFQRGVDAALDRLTQDGDLPSFINSIVSRIDSDSETSRALIERMRQRLPDPVASIEGPELNDVLSNGVTAVAGAGSMYIGLPILLSLLLDEEETEAVVDERLSTLLGGELSPPAQERLERELGLEPMTLASLQKLTTPGRLEQLRGEIESNREFVRELEAEFESHADLLAALSELEAELSIESVQYFFSTALTEALQPVSALTDDYQGYQTFELTERLDLEQAEAEAAVETIAEQANREQTVLGEDSLDDLSDGLVPIYGTLGIGKSSYLRQVGAILQSNGVGTGLVKSQTPEVLQTRVRSLATTYDQVALFVEYQPGQMSPEEFRELFGQRLYDDWDVLFVEVNDADKAGFSKVWGSLHGAGGAKAARRLKPTIEERLEPLDSVAMIPKTLGIEKESTIAAVESAAEGNPLVAFEASILARTKGPKGIRGRSREGILDERLEGAIGSFEDSAPPGTDPRAILEILAAAHEIRTGETEDGDGATEPLEVLVELGGASETDRAVRFVSSKMDGYLRYDATSCRLQPSIYRSLLFDRVWFAEGQTNERAFEPECCLKRFKNEYPEGLIGVVLNLGELRAANAVSTDPPAVEEAGMQVLEIAEQTPVLDRVLLQAGETGLQLPLTEIPVERFAGWADGFAETDLMEERLFRGIGNVGGANQPESVPMVEGWGEHGEAVYDAIETPRNERWVDLTVMYSFLGMAITGAETAPGPVFEAITERVRNSAAETTNVQNSLSNYFSLILWPQVRDRNDPDSFELWFDVLEEQIAERFEQPEREQTYILTYALLVARFAPPAPGEIAGWLEAAERRLTRRAESETPVGTYADLGYTDERLVYLRQFYGIVIGNVGNRYPDDIEALQDWTRFAISRVDKHTASSPADDITQTGRQSTNRERAVPFILKRAIDSLENVDERADWVQALVKEATRAANEREFSPQIIGSIHALPIAATIKNSSADRVSCWLDLVEESFERSGAGFDLLTPSENVQGQHRFTLCALVAASFMKLSPPTDTTKPQLEQLRREATAGSGPMHNFHAYSLFAVGWYDGPARVEEWLDWIVSEELAVQAVLEYLNTSEDGDMDLIAEEQPQVLQDAWRMV